LKNGYQKNFLQRPWIPVAFVLFALTGCSGFFVPPDNSGGGGGGGGGTGTARVYVANTTVGSNGSTGSISGFSIGDGTLTAVPNSPVALQFQPLALTITPSNSFLYIAGPSSINVYAINSDGSLTAQNNGAVVTVASLDVSPDGKWLLGVDTVRNVVDQFQIDPTSGALSAATGSPFNVDPNAIGVPKMIKVSPNGNFVFLALGAGGESVLTFNSSTGALTPGPTFSLGSRTSDNGIAVNSTSSYLYVARSGNGGGVAVYNIGADGSLNSISGSPFAAGAQPIAVTLDTTGKNLYVANGSDNTISGYSIGTGSALTALGGSPYASGTQVNSLGVENTGKYLFAGASGGPDLSMYSFDATTPGKLNLVKSIATDTDPAGVSAIAVTH
jgi:6-phosphogluconolactonase